MRARKRAHICLFLEGVIILLAAMLLRRQWIVEPVYPSPALSEVRSLSYYHPPLSSTLGDTDIYFFDSGQPGGTLLVLGGTHANEPAGSMAAIVLIENLRVNAGRVFVIPHANAAAATHNDSQ